ncbi:MAG: DUF4253 domain-containing protein [Phycisphaerales bacterium]|nr:DUF4253 domain-containing protein [Phycisphaerales bacterium]
MERMKALCGEIKIESVPTTSAVERWRELRAQTHETGIYPLLLGPPVDAFGQVEDLEFIELGESGPWTQQDVMSKATPAAIAEFIAERERDAAEAAEELGEYPERGEWPDQSGTMTDPDEFLLLRNHDGKLVDSLLLGHVPARTGAEAIGAIAYGAWNDCPMPWVHVAYVRQWQERFGVELVVCSSDTLEFVVSRPPTTRESAIELTLEHFRYCSDIVDQGTETIERLANELLDAPRWFFWWD